MSPDLNWLDIAALLVIAVFSLEGLIKGLVISLFNIISFFGAIYIAKITSAYITEYIIKNTLIDESVAEYFLGNIPAVNLSVSPALKILGRQRLNPEDILASAMILTISFIVLFIVAKICLNLIAGIFDTAAKLPVIRHFNRLGGLLFGGLKGVLLLYIFFAVMTPVIPILSSYDSIVSAIDTSVFASNFYRYNLIVPWISGKFM